MSNTRHARKLITAPANWLPGAVGHGVDVGQAVELTPIHDPADVFDDEPEAMLAWYAPLTELTPDEYEQRLRSAHTLVMSGSGVWLPLPLPGYLKDGTLPNRALAVLFEAQAGLLSATEQAIEHNNLPEPLKQVQVFGCADGRRRFNLNLVGSILSWLIGRMPYPWHGPMAFMAAPGDDGIVRKLTWPQKTFLLTCGEQVITALTGGVPSTGPLSPAQVQEIRTLTEMIYNLDALAGVDPAQLEVAAPQALTMDTSSM